jgi:hypothetical protein
MAPNRLQFGSTGRRAARSSQISQRKFVVMEKARQLSASTSRPTLKKQKKRILSVRQSCNNFRATCSVAPSLETAQKGTELMSDFHVKLISLEPTWFCTGRQSISFFHRSFSELRRTMDHGFVGNGN